MPWLSAEIANMLMEHHVPARPRILIPVAGEKRGHPVLFPWALADDVRTLPAGTGINHLRSVHPYREISVPQSWSIRFRMLTGPST